MLKDMLISLKFELKPWVKQTYYLKFTEIFNKIYYTVVKALVNSHTQ